MSARTSSFIKALLEVVNEVLPTFYETASTKGVFPFAVVNGLNTIDLSAGDLTSFYIDIYADEKKQGAAVELEEYCDALRNNLSSAVIKKPGEFGAHLGFENQNGIVEGEHDLMHRRLSISARVFYN